MRQLVSITFQLLVNVLLLETNSQHNGKIWRDRAAKNTASIQIDQFASRKHR